jgi:hypothetical protein
MLCRFSQVAGKVMPIIGQPYLPTPPCCGWLSFIPKTVKQEKNVPDIMQQEVEGLHAWATMLIHPGAYDVTDLNVQVDFFGATGDAAYLVIDLYTSPNCAAEYCFLAADETDEPQSARLIFDFLREMDYSLSILLAWLAVASFTDTEMGEQVIHNRLAIWRKYS